MNPIKHPSATHCFKAPIDWDAEKNGPCDDLWITRVADVLLSVWRPTDEERAAIAAGADLGLWVYGSSHPAVSIGTVPVEPSGFDTLPDDYEAPR
jgi:hypothetical protein